MTICVALGLCLCGCDREPDMPKGAPASSPPTAEAAPASVPHPSTPRSASVSPTPDAPIKSAAPAELAQRLRAESEAEERGKIVEELWALGTPEAVEFLRQHFHVERDTDVKADIVAGLVETNTPETRELRFGILSSALAVNQPPEVREAAIAVVSEFDDVRAVALLQNLLQDRSEEIRAAAREAIEARRENEVK